MVGAEKADDESAADGTILRSTERVERGARH